MHVSKSTFHRYKNELIQDGLIVVNSEGMQINTHFFPTFLSVPKELKDFDKQMEENANIDSDFKGSRIYTTYEDLKAKGFAGLRMPLKDLPDALMSGTFFIKSETEKRHEPFAVDF